MERGILGQARESNERWESNSRNIFSQNDIASRSSSTPQGHGRGQSTFLGTGGRPPNTSGGRAVGIYTGQDNHIANPNQKVSKAENDFINPDQRDLGYCVRPGYGSQGDQVRLWTNYFELTIPSSNLILFYYTITIDPENKKNGVPKGKKRKQIIRLIMKDRSYQALEPTLVASDFNMILLTRKPLNFKLNKDKEKVAKFRIRYQAEGARQPSEPAMYYNVRVQLSHTLGVDDFRDYLDPNQMTSVYNESPILPALNVILSHYAKQSDKLAIVGSRKVFPFRQGDPMLEPKDLDQRLVALRGFYSSVTGATSRILVNVNISHGVFYQAIRLRDLIKYWGREVDYDELHCLLKKLRVTTNHLSPEHPAFGKVRTICGLAVDSDGARQAKPPIMVWPIGGDPSEVKFHEDSSRFASDQDGAVSSKSSEAILAKQRVSTPEETKDSYITVKDFFLKSYPRSKIAQNLEKDVPVVNVGTSAKPIYLPADVCIVQPGQLSRSKLNGPQSQKMIGFAKCTPDECAESIVAKGRQVLGCSSPSQTLDYFGVSVGRDLITVPGRVLASPVIEYKPKPPQDELHRRTDFNARQRSKQDKPRLEENSHSSHAEKRDGADRIYEPVEGSWNFGQRHLYKAVTLKNWHVLRIALRETTNNLPPKTTLEAHLKKFRDGLRNGGIESHDPSIERIVIDDTNFDDPPLEKYFEKVSEHEVKAQQIPQMATGSKVPTGSLNKQTPSSLPLNKYPTEEIPDPDIPLLLVILPCTMTKLYQKIKILADTKEGFHTICVIGTGADKGDLKPYERYYGSDKKFYGGKPDQYFANIALKINLKLRGISHKLQNREAIGPIAKGSTMVVGIDVTHPSPGSNNNAPSIFAIVASTDEHLLQWPAALGVQRKSREEVISDTSKLGPMFQSRLIRWRENNNKLPENIIVYRDGVSGSEYKDVLDKELKALKEACTSQYSATETGKGLPRFTFIVVAKRIHTRFYPTSHSQRDSKGNAKCGTVVDRGITQARTWDFFLQSHSVVSKGGTARPTHYVVLHDEVFVDDPNRVNLLQQITYNMCYLYGPSTRAISVCPPVYLADKACTRARLYLHDEFGPPPPGVQDDKKDEKDETPEDRDKRLADEAKKLKSQQDKIIIARRLRNSTFYV